MNKINIKKMEYFSIKNMTPHPVNVCDKDGNQIFYVDPCGEIARIDCEVGESKIIKMTNGKNVFSVPVSRLKYGKCEQLPEEGSEGYIIVSALVKRSHPRRKDLLVPMDFIKEGKDIKGCVVLGL